MNRIRDLRLANGWTQGDLADRMNTAKSVVSRYETERLGLDVPIINRLCNIFGCTADYLLGRSDSPLPVISPEDAELLAAYHALPLAIRQAVDGLLEPYRPQAQEKKPAAGSM